MMKRLIQIATVTFVLLCLSACFYVPHYDNSVYYNGRVDLLVLLQYSVPFVDDLSLDPVGNIEIYPSETDSYGRTLGIMQLEENAPLFAGNAVYCILQSGSKEESCFYEDVCCVMVKNGNPPEEAIKQLKQVNDWNQPLALEKCRKVPIQNYHASGVLNTFYTYTNYRELACNSVHCDERNAWLEVLCKDGCGLWMFALVEHANADELPVYLIMMKEESSSGDKNPALTVIDTSLLENRDSPWEEIHAFKEAMGWQFVNPASN